VEELLDIVQRKDDRLLPVFCRALIEKDQAGAAKLIRQNLAKQQQLQQQQQLQGEPGTSSSFCCIF